MVAAGFVIVTLIKSRICPHSSVAVNGEMLPFVRYDVNAADTPISNFVLAYE